MENPQTTWKRCWTSSVDPLQHGTARADQCSLSLRYATAGVLSLYLLRCCEANNKGFHTGEKAVKEYWGARGLLAAVGAGVWRKTPRPPTSGARHRHWRSGNSGVILFIPSSILLQSIFSNSSCCPKIWNLYNFPTSRSSRCGHQAHWGETCRLPHHLPTAARMAPSRSHIKSAKTLIQIWLLFCTWSLWMDRDSYMPLQSFKYFQAKFQAKTWNQAAKRGESKSMKYVSYKSYICLGGLKKKLEFITHISLHPGLKVVSTS